MVIYSEQHEYRMKKFLGLLLVAFMAFSVSACYTHRHHPHGMPPGQAKKKYGGKSAKRYAPGQQKKKYKGNKGRHNHPGHRVDVMWHY